MAFHRYVALGDSFTEGVGDPDPTRPNGLRGWADRVAEELAKQVDGFGYANLAIRGRKLDQIIDEQLEPALALDPDLVSIYAGANDILRPAVDIDRLVTRYGEAIGRLRENGATVVVGARRVATVDTGGAVVAGALDAARVTGTGVTDVVDGSAREATVVVGCTVLAIGSNRATAPPAAALNAVTCA